MLVILESAKQIYTSLLAEYAFERDQYVRIQAEDKPDHGSNDIPNPKLFSEEKMNYFTSLALLLGSKVMPDYNHGMYTYLTEFEYLSPELVLDLARQQFIQLELSKLPSTNTTLRYESGGKTEEKVLLEKGKGWVLDIPEAQRNNYSLAVTQGLARKIFEFLFH